MHDDTDDTGHIDDAAGPLGTDTAAQRFKRVAALFTEVVDSVGPGQWGLPAPCEGWVARDVVGHLVTWVPSVVGKGGVSFDGSPAADADPAGAWRHLAAVLQAALDDPGTAARTFDAGPPGMMSVEAAIDMLVTGDVMVHTWDLATAIGRSVQLDEGIVAGMYEGMQHIDEILRSSGHYGPKFDVPADADTQTKLIAFTGRNPFWTAA
jgi:uncharacterized protein (TIGR03086 family)